MNFICLVMNSNLLDYRLKIFWFEMICYLNEWMKSGSVFWFCALLGSGIFLIQWVLHSFGAGTQNDVDFGDVSSVQQSSQDSLDIKNFKWVSTQTITGFLMMFGWTAITCQEQFGLETWMTVGVSLGSGVFAAFMIHFVFKLAKHLRSPGSVYRLEDAIGKEGYVYQCIPKGGQGKVSISLHNLTYEIDAVSHQDEDLPSFVRVKIIEKSDDTTVVVAPL